MSEEIIQYDFSKGENSLAKAQAMEVKTQGDYETAARVWLSLRSGEAEVENILGENKKKAYTAYKSASDIYNKAMGMFRDAAGIIKDKMEAYAVKRATLPEAEGVTLKSAWKAEVTDIRALMQAVLANNAPADLIAVNERKLAAMATSLKDSLNIPGVQVKEDKTLCLKSGRSKEGK